MSAVSAVVLTMGDRPAELTRAIASVRLQSGVETEVVLVVNGGEVDHQFADVVVTPGTNLGIPGGRNAGAAAASSELLLFLDDDGELVGNDILATAVDRFRQEQDLAAIGLRIVDEYGTSSRRHQPTLQGGVASRRDVTAFPGGGVIVSNAVFAAVGGLCDEFRYALEETDLAWRMIDCGYRVSFDPTLAMAHPRTDIRRHPDAIRLTARNRVWLAHRNLPFILALLYVMNWTIVSAVRSCGRIDELKAHLSGTADGIRNRLGPRKPIRWRTVLTLARLGRPPLL